jgi:CheY-like chemotaxis protein
MPAAAKPHSQFEFSPVSLDRVRVLIVDDEPDARRVLTFALQTVGALVTAATSVAEAMMLLPTTNPHWQYHWTGGAITRLLSVGREMPDRSS